MPRIPRQVRAIPTLSGLRVRTRDREKLPAVPELFPWETLELNFVMSDSSQWTPVEDDHAVQSDQRPLLVTISGKRINRVALRAYLRYLRPAWKSGDITHNIIRRGPSWFDRIGILICAMMLLTPAAVIGSMAAKTSTTDWSLYIPVESRPLAWTLLFLGIGMLVLFPVSVIGLLIRTLVPRSDFREASFCHRGIRVRKRDGHEKSYRWDEVADYRTTGIQFEEGCWMRWRREEGPSFLLRRLWEEKLPDQIRELRSIRQRAMARRCGMYFLLGGILLWFASGYSPETMPIHARLTAVGLFTAFGILLSWAISRSLKKQYETGS